MKRNRFFLNSIPCFPLQSRCKEDASSTRLRESQPYIVSSSTSRDKARLVAKLRPFFKGSSLRHARYLTKGQRLSAYLGLEAVTSLFLSILRSPVTSSLDGGILVLLPSCCDVVGKRVVWVWCAEEGLNGEEDGANLQGRGPVAYAC
jgi:hypothetical protein